MSMWLQEFMSYRTNIPKYEHFYLELILLRQHVSSVNTRALGTKYTDSFLVWT